MSKLLLVDDDANTLASLSRAFRLAGHEAVVCDNADRALELARSQRFDMILSDVVMPGKDGIQLLEELKSAGVTTPVVMISGQANVEIAVRATRLGAVDFLEKPLSTDKLLLTLENVVKLARLESENRQLKKKVGKHQMVYRSAVMQSVMARVERVAASETRVCILGETGTGKELVARTVHERSSRRDNPFVTLNCAAVPAELIESELFGHEKGSFTGAGTRHLGKFEQAQGGTLLLDEISEMGMALQAKLLRVLQEREVERIGGTRTIKLDVRVIATSNRQLPAEVAAGRFREDLYYRLNVMPLRLQPLRARPRDVLPLAERVLARLAAPGQAPLRLAPAAAARLAAHDWPGNVRELDNVMQRAAVLAAGATLEASEIVFEHEPAPDATSLPVVAAEPGQAALEDGLKDRERDLILAALESSRGSRKLAAERLGISARTLRYKLAQLRAAGVAVP